MSCPSLETIGGWSVGELSAADNEAFEEHWFSCERCLPKSERMLALVAFLRTMTPTFLTPSRRQQLEAAGPLPVVPIAVGGEGELHFDGRERGMWVFRAELSGIDRVDADFLDEGAKFKSFVDVPFDAGRGEIALACRTQYRVMGPARFTVRLTGTAAGETKPIGDYVVHHFFDAV